MKTILVPVDFSPVTTRLVAAAKAFAELGNYRIALLHVASNDEGWVARSIMPISVVVPEDSGRLHQALRDLRASFGATATAVRTLLIEGGSVACNILSESQEMKADLIIMGGHIRSAWSRFLIGSVTSTVVSCARCRVIVVPNGVQAFIPVAA